MIFVRSGPGGGPGKLLTPARPRACIEQCERNCMSPSVGPVRRSGSTARRNGRSRALVTMSSV
jgi:hypothetical protein